MGWVPEANRTKLFCRLGRWTGLWSCWEASALCLDRLITDSADGDVMRFLSICDVPFPDVAIPDLCNNLCNGFSMPICGSGEFLWFEQRSETRMESSEPAGSDTEPRFNILDSKHVKWAVQEVFAHNVANL